MYSRAVLTSFCYVPRAEVDAAALRAALTARSRFDPETEIPLYDDSKVQWFGLPLYYKDTAGQLASRIDDMRIVTPDTGLRFTSQLWPGQPEVLARFERFLHIGATGFILEAKPGFGKTVTAIAMMERLKQRTLVVVPRSNLIAQWRERLKAHSNLKDWEIGVVEAGRAVWDGCKVVVALVHSLVLDRYGPDFRKYFGAVFYDEVDRSVPPKTFAPAVAMFPAKYRVGISATLKRSDGLDVIFRMHLAQAWLQGKDANRMKPSVLVVYYPGSSGYISEDMPVIYRRGMLLSALAGNDRRNAMLADYIVKILASGRRCLVLSDRISQLVDLAGLVRGLDRNLVPEEEDVGFYVRTLFGKTTTKAAQKRIAERAKLILATYGMFSIGSDIPALAGLVYATPQSHVEQSKGRIERMLEGKKQPVVVDVVDRYYEDAENWFKARLKLYQRQGLQIKFVERR